MYLGRVAELGEHQQVYDVPAHPYTQALLSAEPGLARQGRKRIVLAGDPPSPVMPPSGCRFHTRCLRAESRCSSEEPQLRQIPSGQTVSCHFAEEHARPPTRQPEGRLWSDGLGWPAGRWYGIGPWSA